MSVSEGLVTVTFWWIPSTLRPILTSSHIAIKLWFMETEHWPTCRPNTTVCINFILVWQHFFITNPVWLVVFNFFVALEAMIMVSFAVRQSRRLEIFCCVLRIQIDFELVLKNKIAFQWCFTLSWCTCIYKTSAEKVLPQQKEEKKNGLTVIETRCTINDYTITWS